jgi:cytoskeletal protein CcmA (bactofilin family)
VRRLLVLLTGLIAALAAASPAAAATVENHSGGPIVVVDGDVTVGPKQEADGVYMVHGHAMIAGRVSGDVVIVDGDLHLLGRIDGDLVMVSGRAYLARGSSVSGDVTYGDEEPRIARGARVGGDVQKETWSDVLGLYSIIGALVLWLAIGISAAVLGILLLVLSPRAADAVFEQAEERFWTAVGIGVGIAVAVPIAIFVAAVTVVGLPLAIGLGLAALPFAAIAYVTAAWTLGRVMVKPPHGRIPAFLAGLGILRLAALVPGVGLLVGLAAVIVGLGLLAAAIAGARQPVETHAQGT